jgi:hypothetical protein
LTHKGLTHADVNNIVQPAMGKKAGILPGRWGMPALDFSGGEP